MKQKKGRDVHCWSKSSIYDASLEQKVEEIFTAYPTKVHRIQRWLK